MADDPRTLASRVLSHPGLPPVRCVRRHELDPGGAFRAEQVEERLKGGPVVAFGDPHQPAGVVIDNDHQILVTAPIRDLVNPDPDEPIKRVMSSPSISDNTAGDRADTRHPTLGAAASMNAFVVLIALTEFPQVCSSNFLTCEVGSS